MDHKTTNIYSMPEELEYAFLADTVGEMLLDTETPSHQLRQE